MDKHRFSSLRLVASIIFFVAILALGALGLGNHLLNSSSSSTGSVVNCKQLGQTHTVTISNDAVSPLHTQGHACDRLKIINKDNVIRLMAFGPHEHHVPYDGVAEEVLDKNQSFSVTLNQLGNFQFHDHIHDWVKGTFTVVK